MMMKDMDFSDNRAKRCDDQTRYKDIDNENDNINLSVFLRLVCQMHAANYGEK